MYLLKHKSDVAIIIPKFFNLVYTQFNAKIKTFKSDNAKELLFDEFFADKGVVHQFSCVERPEQNSVVERKHQHLLNVARALFFQSRVPIAFWTDCVLTATFLINRTPSPLLHNKTPYELLHNSPVDYSMFKVFGCLAFASTLHAHRTKFDPRARVCVFMGYPVGMKGYRLYDIQAKQFFISRDVVFLETIFPFHHVIDASVLSDPFPDLVLPVPLSVSLSTLPASSPSPLPTRPSTIDHPPLFIPKKSTSITKPPSYLRDFHCHLLHHHSYPNLPSSSYPLSNSLGYDSLSLSHKNFILNVSTHFEPQFYHQAAGFKYWRDAMKSELEAMEDNKTWSIVPLPASRQSIGCKWVYKIKFNTDGSVARYKARLVAKGYTQQEGVDFLDTFSPVAKLVTVKVLLALAAQSSWHLVQLDVNNAFLNGDLFEEIYMDIPLGYGRKGEFTNSDSKLVCKLHKSIYGLK